jgi:hypothetical protein
MTQEEADNLSIGDLITITHWSRSSDDRCNEGAYNVILMGYRDVPTLSGAWRTYEVYDHGGKIKRVSCEQIVKLVNS